MKKVIKSNPAAFFGTKVMTPMEQDKVKGGFCQQQQQQQQQQQVAAL